MPSTSLVREPTAATWSALSALRGKRIFHPDGVAYEAELAVHADGPATGAPLFDVPGRHRAIVRASRGAGLPEGLRFNPWYTGGGIRPAGPLQGIRGDAYRGSQRGSGR